MPKRIIESTWRHVRSPFSARAATLLLLLGLIAYTVINNYLENQRSERNHAEIIQNQEEAVISREELKRQTDVTIKAVDGLEAAIGRIPEMNRSIKDVAEILKLDRTSRERDHTAIQKALRSQLRRPRRKLSPCYEERIWTEQDGRVIKRDLVRKPRCK